MPWDSHRPANALHEFRLSFPRDPPLQLDELAVIAEIWVSQQGLEEQFRLGAYIAGRPGTTFYAPFIGEGNDLITVWVHNEEQVRVLQLFNDLFWFDMMHLLRPKGTGRVGGAMLDELDKFLTPLNFEQISLVTTVNLISPVISSYECKDFLALGHTMKAPSANWTSSA